MARLSQSKHAPHYEVRAQCLLCCEAKIIYFHVFNVSLSRLGGKNKCSSGIGFGRPWCSVGTSGIQ